MPQKTGPQNEKILWRYRNRDYKNGTVCRIMGPVNSRTGVSSGERGTSMNGFTYLMNQAERGTRAAKLLTSREAVSPAHRFHAGMDGYCPTPLVSLEQQAKRLGLGALLMKDESKRFGLNAFKVLGGSYAIAKYLCGRLEIPVDEYAFARLRSPEAKAMLGEITFVTATDGQQEFCRVRHCL